MDPSWTFGLSEACALVRASGRPFRVRDWFLDAMATGNAEGRRNLARIFLWRNVLRTGRTFKDPTQQMLGGSRFNKPLNMFVGHRKHATRQDGGPCMLEAPNPRPIHN